MSCFKSAIKYGFVVCPAIDQIRSSKRTLLYESSEEKQVYTVASALMEYGFIPSKKMIDDMFCTDITDLTQIFNNLITTLDEITSTSKIRKSRMFYRNFPDVPYDLLEQRILAIIHYYSHGTFFPEEPWSTAFKKATNLDETANYKILDFVTLKDLSEFVCKELVISKNSLPVDDMEFVREIIKTCDNTHYNIAYALNNIVHKEILANFIVSFINESNSNELKDFVIANRTFDVNDVLRIATVFSNGDASLAENTKFKLARWQRKFLCELLLSTDLSVEQALVHKNKWVKLLHCMHVGEYSLKLWKWSKFLRENIRVDTFNSVTERLFHDYKVTEGSYFILKDLCVHLSKKPSMFIRNFNRLVQGVNPENAYNKMKTILLYLEDTIQRGTVPNRIIYQLYSFILNDTIENRIFFPKGMKTKFYVEQTEYKRSTYLDDCKDEICLILNGGLMKNFADRKEDRKVYISPDMYKCSMNNGLRNVTPGKQVVSRGCKIPFKCDNTLRMFLHWIGHDLDLGVSFFNKNFAQISECSYRQTRSGNFAQHSGDIIEARAPKGASEYVDLDIKKAVDFGVRYAAMYIFVYRDQKFSELEKCCVGWMERENPESNEIYDPRTVKQYIDLTSESKIYTPVVFDLVEKTVCYVDINAKVASGFGFNISKTGFSNQALLFKSMITKKSLSLGGALFLSCQAKEAEIVGSPEKADVIFDLESGITPYNYIELEKWI